MAEALRIATYNVEWFDHLFDDRGQLACDDGPSGRYGITRAEQTAALIQVFRALDADAVLVVEAPDIGRRRDGAAALQGFAEQAGLRARAVLRGFANDTQQELLLLYDPERIVARHDPCGWPPGLPGDGSPRFDGRTTVDLGEDGRPETATWSKPPLEAALKVGGRALRLIGVHAKSKAPIGAKDRAAMRRLAIANRRKQLAQCLWLRERVVEHLQSGDSLIVLGDFNDGPGLDTFEEVSGRSSVEIVLGEGLDRLYDPHAMAALAGPTAGQPATARFRTPDGWLSALLDYIMVSPDLMDFSPRWEIWHPFDNRRCYADRDLRDALLHASDHFPVTLDLNLLGRRRGALYSGS